MEILAFGSAMYILGLFSCAFLVWILTRIPVVPPINPGNIKPIAISYWEHKQNESLSHAAKMCIQHYCSI